MYKVTPPASQDEVTEIRHTNFKNYYPSVNRSMAWDSMSPYVSQATHTYLKKWMGSENITIAKDIGADPDPTSEEKEYYDLVATALAYYAVYEAMPHINVFISDMGITDQTNETTMPTSRWRYQQARQEAIIKADKFLDLVLDVITSETMLDKPLPRPVTFTLLTKQESDFFKTTDQLAQIINTSGRRMYVSLIPYLKKAEYDLKKYMCHYYEDILTWIDHEDHTELIYLCRLFIAQQALIYAIPQLSFIIDSDGLRLLSSSESFKNETNVLSSFGKDGPDKLISSLKLDSKKILSDIHNHLISDPAKYQAYIDTLATTDSSTITVGDDECVGGVGFF